MNLLTPIEREQAIMAGAAAIVFGMVASGRLAPKDQDADAMIDSAFVLAERFIAKAEARATLKQQQQESP